MDKRIPKAGIIGTGLMGGSLALALRSNTGISRVVAYDISEKTRREAVKLGVADEVVESPVEAVDESDFVFLATPVGELTEVFAEIREYLKPGAVVSDLGSTKLRVTTAIEEMVPRGVHYVGGHPMTGSEQSGVESARGDLYNDCYYILTPTSNTDTEAFRRLHGLLTDIGARVISMEPEAHDRAMATISHVPHLLSLLLMDMARKHREKIRNLFTVAAGGFRDMTRIAASSPDLWTDICMENREFIVERLEEYQEEIRGLVATLEKDDREGLKDLFEKARRARSEFSLKAGQEIEGMFEVSMPVPDRPGVISTVSTAMGSLGVNIEDLGIVHPLEGETGILTLRILGEVNARQALQELESKGYRVSLRRV